MSKNKTTTTDRAVLDFIDSYVENEQKKKDSLQLLDCMQDWSGHVPKMWGATIIGFGSYHYKYASGHEGDAPLIGFSPRKAEFSIYAYTPCAEADNLLQELGKFKMGKACLYVKKLSDIDLPTLEKIARTTISYLKKQYG